MQQQEVFKDLVVVELAGVLAGPAVGMFFAELGARVVKVENKRQGGDLTRKWKLPVEDPSAPASAYYHSVNWNKEVLFIDLSDPSGRTEVGELIRTADILLVNFKAGDAEKFGLSSYHLRQLHPALIIGEITGFDDSARVAFDAILQAETGFMSMNGEEEGQPLKMPVALIDVLAAHQLKEGLLIALQQRMKTGEGAVVRASLYRSAIASLMNQASIYLNEGEIPRRLGSLHPAIAPYGEVFICGDNRQLLLAVGTDEQFRKLCRVLGCEGLADDTRYATNAARVLNRKLLFEALAPAFRGMTSVECLSRLNEFHVPAGSVNDLAEVFSSPTAASMVLEQAEPDGTISRRVSTVAFEINPK